MFYELKEKVIEKKLIVISLLLLIIIICLSYYLLSNDKKEEVIIEEEIIEKEEEIVVNDECFVYVDIKGLVVNPNLYKVECGMRVNDVIEMAGGLKKDADTSVINLGKKVFDEMVIVIYSKNEVNDFTKVEIDENIKEEKCINYIVKNDACVTKNNRVEKSVIVSENSITTSNNSISNLISINNGSLEELMTLTGIGESKAKAIIKYREDNNGFKSLDELKNISGIGDKVFEKIKDSITL